MSLLPKLAGRLWSRRKLAAAGPGLLPAYRHDNALRRNRKKLFFALFIAVILYVMAFQLIGRFIIVQFLVPLLLLFFLVIWALPERGRAPTSTLRFLFFAFAGSLVLWPDYLALALPGMPWMTAIRLTGFPMVLILLICISVSDDFSRQLKSVLSASRPIAWLMATLAVLMVFSVAVSTNMPFSFNRLVVMLVSLVAAFYVASYVFAKPGTALRFVFFLWAVIILLAVLTYFEVRSSQVPWAGRIPSFLKIEDENVQRILAGQMRATTKIYRAQTKFTTSLSFAEFLALTAPFILHIAMTATKVWLRPLAWLTLPLIFWMIVKTESRMGAAGFLMTFIVYLLVWGGLRWYRNRDSIFGPAITLAYPIIFAAFITATFFVGRLRAMVWGSAQHQFSDQGRQVQWDMAIPRALERPWGYGLGQGGGALGYTNQAGMLTIDSYYISVLLEIGIIGFVAYFAVFISTILLSVPAIARANTEEERLLAPIAISLVNFIIIKSVLSQQEGHPIAFIFVGMAVALIWRVKQQVAVKT